VAAYPYFFGVRASRILVGQPLRALAPRNFTDTLRRLAELQVELRYSGRGGI
jgi:hypothetical protein